MTDKVEYANIMRKYQVRGDIVARPIKSGKTIRILVSKYGLYYKGSCTRSKGGNK